MKRSHILLLLFNDEEASQVPLTEELTLLMPLDQVLPKSLIFHVTLIP